MSLHAIKPEVQARLHRQRRASFISSVVIGFLVVVLFMLILSLMLLSPMFKETPTIVTYESNALEETELVERKVTTSMYRRPSSPSSSMAKVITATIVAPLITIAVGSAVSVLLLAIFGAAFASLGLNLFPLVLSNPDFYLMPLQLLGLLPVYILWALPTAGWLLMVSAWAKSKVFLWAVGVPLVTVAVIAWGNFLLKTRLDLDWLVQNVVARGLVGFIPGTWMPLSHADMAQFDELMDPPAYDALLKTL